MEIKRNGSQASTRAGAENFTGSVRVEPFGPLVLVSRFRTLEQGLAEANRLPYGLAAYAFTQSAATASEAFMHPKYVHHVT